MRRSAGDLRQQEDKSATMRRLDAPSVMDVSKLFQGAPEVRLRHDNQEYRLRLTKNNKLILTK